MSLYDIVGQPVVVSCLKNAVDSGKVSHAYLFWGDDGLGKETTAKQFAAHLLCDTKTACGTCDSCRLIAEDQHLSLHVVEPESSIKIDQIREIKNRCALAQEGPVVWIVKQSEKLTHQAANSFLKLLEEPLGNTVFILLTQNVNSLLPTIVSRCQVLAFRPLAEDILIEQLVARVPRCAEDKTLAALVARMGRGSLGRALELLEGPLLEKRQKVLDCLAAIPDMTYPTILGYSMAWEEDKHEILMDLQLMLQWCRDLACVAEAPDVPLYNQDYRSKLVTNCRLYSKKSILEISQTIPEMVSAISGNARPRFIIGHLLLMFKKGAQA